MGGKLGMRTMIISNAEANPDYLRRKISGAPCPAFLLPLLPMGSLVAVMMEEMAEIMIHV